MDKVRQFGIIMAGYPATRSDGNGACRRNFRIIFHRGYMENVNSFAYILIGVAGLLLSGIIASKASDKLGVPALLLFLAIGILAGSEGLGGLHFDYPNLAQTLGVFALAFILFAGGLDTKFSDIKPVFWKGLALSTIGVTLTAVFTGLFAHYILGISLIESMLIGAIVSSTDAAAVFAVLRSRKVKLKDHLKSLLEFESGSNDPMAVFLTTGLIAIIAGRGASFTSLIPSLIVQMLIGGIIGYFFGKASIFLVNKLRLGYEGLYPVLTISLLLLCYGSSVLSGGNAFLAVYIAGMVLGNSEILHKRSLFSFHDGLAWLMQITMFVTLGLQVFPSQLLQIAKAGLLISVFLMLVGRPLSVFLSLSLSRMPPGEKLFVSWVGLRGAVPIILATFPLLAGIPEAGRIFNIVFFIVVTSALLQGTSIPFLAKLLHLNKRDMPAPKSMLISNIKNWLTEIHIAGGSALANKRIVDLNLPQRILFILVARKEEIFVPNGGTLLQVDDKVLVAAEKDDILPLIQMGKPGPSKVLRKRT